MIPKKFGAGISPLVIGGVFVSVLVLLVFKGSQPVQAEPAALFVASDGSGAACTQADPCDLATALGKAEDGDSIYFAQGNYYGTGAAVLVIANNVSLYAGWDGTTSIPVEVNPLLFPTTLDGQKQRRGVEISAGVSTTLDGFTILGGYSEDSGGGIYAENAHSTIVNNLIEDNHSDRDGGAIFINRGSAEILNNRIINNEATWSGGLRIINNADVSIIGNVIRGNMAEISAGGIDIDCCGGFQTFVAQNIIVENNSGDRGGGVIVNATHALFVNNILARNEAPNGAGVWLDGMDSYPVNVELINNTIVGGSNGDQAVWVGEYVTGTLINNILTNHDSGIVGTTPSSNIISADHNIFWNTSDPFVGQNPLLVDPLVDIKYHLTSLSPAIDAGASVNLGTDIDGDLRPINDYDIGADEYYPKVFIPVVTKLLVDR
jgi:hypothetical protein